MTTILRRLPVLLGIVLLAACAQNATRLDSKQETAAQINVRLGVAYLQQGDRNRALNKFQHAIKLDPSLASAHQYIAEVYKLDGEYKQAEQHYQRAIKLDSRNAGIKNNYGVFLCDRGRYAEARELFLKAANTKSYMRADEAYENAGLCALRAARSADAEQYFRRALQINGKRRSSLYQLAKISYKKQLFIEARAFLQRFTDINKPTPESLRLAIRIEHALGNDQQVQYFSRILRDKFPDAEKTAPFLVDDVK